LIVLILISLLLSTILIAFAAVFELRARDLELERYRLELAKLTVRYENLQAFVRRASRAER
jgi:hypothetical protein